MSVASDSGGGPSAVEVTEVNTDGTTTTVVVTASSGNVGPGGAPKVQMPLTPRFTAEEKEVLYTLFHMHEEVIDIKYRKKHRNKYSVRDTWDKIVRDFNSHPHVSAMRNIKQIQKFWLNSRLRKQYPYRDQSGVVSNSPKTRKGGGGGSLKADIIKVEPEYELSPEESDDHNEVTEAFEVVEMDPNDVSEMEEEPLDGQEEVIEETTDCQEHELQKLHHVSGSSGGGTTTTTTVLNSINVDQISTEKLTLNDLLQFKSTRPREEIILQIKHPAEATGESSTVRTLCCPLIARLAPPTAAAQMHQQTQHQQQQHHSMATITTAAGYHHNHHQVISELKPQQITLAQYQQQQHNHHGRLVTSDSGLTGAVVVQQHNPGQSSSSSGTGGSSGVKMQIAAGTPTFTFSTVGGGTTATLTSAANNGGGGSSTLNTSGTSVDAYDERCSYFKLKESELRYTEAQLAADTKKIEMTKVQDELKYMRELHRLRVEELKMKIRILQKEEEQLRKNLES